VQCVEVTEKCVSSGIMNPSVMLCGLKDLYVQVRWLPFAHHHGAFIGNVTSTNHVIHGVERGTLLAQQHSWHALLVTNTNPDNQIYCYTKLGNVHCTVLQQRSGTTGQAPRRQTRCGMSAAMMAATWGAAAGTAEAAKPGTTHFPPAQRAS